MGCRSDLANLLEGWKRSHIYPWIGCYIHKGNSDSRELYINPINNTCIQINLHSSERHRWFFQTIGWRLLQNLGKHAYVKLECSLRGFRRLLYYVQVWTMLSHFLCKKNVKQIKPVRTKIYAVSCWYWSDQWFLANLLVLLIWWFAQILIEIWHSIWAI